MINDKDRRLVFDVWVRAHNTNNLIYSHSTYVERNPELQVHAVPV